MLGERDVTVADRAVTLVKAAAVCAAVLLGAVAFIAVFGLLVEALRA